VRAHRNESWIYGSIDPLMYNIGLPKFSYKQLLEQWIQIPGITCTSGRSYDPFSNQCVFYSTKCESVLQYFHDVTIVITRDKYTVPPENYLYYNGYSCYVYVVQLPEGSIYASLGQPFVRTFYTRLNYAPNLVYLGVSTTVSVRGAILLFPPILIMYLGLTINILPGIIAAFCMEYHYCPRRRRSQK
jgi:hypothetical protein